MGFLDKVKETTKQVGDKAQQLADTGQEKFEDYKGDKRIGELQQQIGALVYGQRTSGAPIDADAQINRLIDEIHEVEHARAVADTEPGPTPDDPGTTPAP